MFSPLPLTRELLLIGGGHSHALVMRMWGMRPLAGVRVTVINPHPTAPYTGMLPGFVAGHYSRDELNIDLVRLARFADARLILDRAIDIDVNNRVVTLQSGRKISFDIASIDIGITSDLPDLPGFSEFGTPAKPLDVFANRWTEFTKTAVSAKVAVIGGGVGGVELAMAIRHGLEQRGVSEPQVTLIERDSALSQNAKSVRDSLIGRLAQDGIRIVEGTRVDKVTSDGVILKDGERIDADMVVGAAGARPHGWLENTDLHLTNGFITVGSTLRSVNSKCVFAVGDCAHLSHAPRPKAGVFAVREAPILFKNLRAALSGGRFQKFHPQRDYLKLISLGEKSAIAEKWELSLQGRALWQWKDRIDRKFMDQFQDLKPMQMPKLPQERADGLDDALGDKPLCGGCGAKVGAKALSHVLAGLPGSERDDVLSLPGDDAAILKGHGRNRQIITTDHLRAFTQDPHMMARIAAVHSLGDIWAMGGKPQAVLSTIILPRLSKEMQAAWLDEIMAAASGVFAKEGASIVGGHTSVGSELTIGFTVTGLCKKNPVTLGCAKAGDHLILTKPIGTGTILAGEMAMLARGEWVANALAQMARAQGDAATILGDAHAMTDVTGFGLAGHLLGIAKASGVGIELSLVDIPVLPGALELAKQGVRSTLYPDNRAQAPNLPMEGNAKAELLFDPQTAGGLVAAISPNDSEPKVRELNELGYEAKVIGRCVDGPPELHLA